MSSAEDVPFVTSPGEAPLEPPEALAVGAGPGSTAAKPASLIISPKSYFEVLELQSLFPVAQPLEVELGSGDGSFLVHYAAAHPGHNFLGVERLLGRLRKIDRKGQRARLTNLRALRVEAGYFLEYMLPPACTRALHVYFPDPWPKRKHRKHRLIGMQFPSLAARVLEPKAVVYLRTDDADYFAQIQDVFAAAGQFVPCNTPAPLAEVITDFEREFHARGTPTLAAAYQLAPR